MTIRSLLFIALALCTAAAQQTGKAATTPTEAGRETDYETGRPVYEAKVFIGDCLPTHPNAVIWFDRGIEDDKKWHSSVSVAEVRNDTLLVCQLHGQLPKVTEVQEAVRNGKCLEIPGIDGPSEP
jgi:hypothetical protein